MATANKNAPKNQKREPQVDAAAAPSVEQPARGRAAKPTYNVPEGGLKSVPTDYDPKTHARLKRQDFATVELYKQFRDAINPLSQYPIPEGKLTEIPADWDRKKHSPLKPADFADQKSFLFFDWQAAELRRKADRLTRKARAQESVSKIGDAKKAKQLIATMQRLRELQETLGAEAIASVESMLAETE